MNPLQDLVNDPLDCCNQFMNKLAEFPILDAYGAQQLVKILLRLTKQGTTILCTIHQPSSQLFAMFHKVLLLADGRISFIGSPHEAVTFFSLYVLRHYFLVRKTTAIFIKRQFTIKFIFPFLVMVTIVHQRIIQLIS